MFRQSIVLGLSGAAAGLLAAGAVTRLLAGMLHGVQPTDRATFALAAAAIVLLAVAASLVPALRAGRISPAETLKSE